MHEILQMLIHYSGPLPKMSDADGTERRSSPNAESEAVSIIFFN